MLCYQASAASFVISLSGYFMSRNDKCFMRCPELIFAAKQGTMEII